RRRSALGVLAAPRANHAAPAFQGGDDMIVRPRRLAFRGSVMASGLVLDDSPRARAAVLQQWQPGHQVFRWPRRLVWMVPAPRRVDCETAIGAPLVEQGGKLSSAPLDPDELKQVAALSTVEAGEAVGHSLAQ